MLENSVDFVSENMFLYSFDKLYDYVPDTSIDPPPTPGISNPALAITVTSYPQICWLLTSAPIVVPSILFTVCGADDDAICTQDRHFIDQVAIICGLVCTDIDIIVRVAKRTRSAILI